MAKVMNANPKATVPKPHCLKTGWSASRGGEDQSIAEAAEEREAEDDRLAHEHLKRAGAIRLGTFIEC
jgi:hypothetical protein